MRVLPRILIGLVLAAAGATAETLKLEQPAAGPAAAPLLRDDGDVRFELRVTVGCRSDEELTAISVSLADTRIAADPAEFAEDGSADIVLEVSSRQLRGINRRLLCRDVGAPEGALRLLKGAYSANASAHCSHPERGSRTLFASTDVDVSYWCAGPTAQTDDVQD